MNYKVILERKAGKQLENIPEPERSRIRDKLNLFKDTGFSPQLDIKKLRVGPYRVLFELREGYVIVVFAILQREKAYS